MVKIDQFLNSIYARKSLNFIDVLVFLFGLLGDTNHYGYGCKIKNDKYWIKAM